MFHGSHVELNKWFKAIYLFDQNSEAISARSLAEDISVTKNTAAKILKKIRAASMEERVWLVKISNFVQQES